MKNNTKKKQKCFLIFGHGMHEKQGVKTLVQRSMRYILDM